MPIYGLSEEEVKMRRLHSVGEVLGILFISLLCGAWVIRGAELGDMWPLDSELVGDTVSRSFSVGGQFEAHASYLVEEGVSDGFTFEIPRLNLGLSSGLSRTLRFAGELEFEPGGGELGLEKALIEFEVDRSLTLRAGVFVVPIGGFNLDHGSPRYDFIRRPLVATEIIPGVLSDLGVGVSGSHELWGSTLARGTSRISGAEGGGRLLYEIYLSNGLSTGIILGAAERTRIASGKGGERLAESPSGLPMLSARVALESNRFGTLGLSRMGGVYNRRYLDGERIDRARRFEVWAFDQRAEVGPLSLVGEVAYARIDVPESLRELYGERQWGAFIDLVLPLLEAPRSAGEDGWVFNAGLRLEYLDYNMGTFSSTGGSRGDEVISITPALAFRPVPGTVFRLNYRREWMWDRVRNPYEQVGGFQLGLATYF